MRTGAPAGRTGYVHEGALYGSDRELLDLVVPFVTGGAEAGEPTLVAFDDRTAGVVREAIGDLPGVTFLPGASQYDRPALTIKRYRSVLQAHVAAGSQRVRAVGTVPHPGLGASWSTWGRYEAAVNRALADLPLWGLCPYDTRTTPQHVLADVRRLHPHLATPDGQHHVNEHVIDPETVAASLPPPVPDSLERLTPEVELVDPSPATARRAIRDLGRRSRVPAGSVDDLLIAASEVVTNALTHGKPPVLLRAWTALDRVVITVTDRGPGPADPLVGLMPAPERSRGGLGLWIAHQLCSDVDLVTDDDGFTVRLIADSSPRSPEL